MAESSPPRTSNSPPGFNMYARPPAQVTPPSALDPVDPALLHQHTYGAWQVVPSSTGMAPQNLPEGSSSLFQLPPSPASFLPVYYPTNAFDSFHSAPLSRMWELSSLSNPVQAPMIRAGAGSNPAGNSVPLSYPIGSSLLPPHPMRLQDSFLSAHMRPSASPNDGKSAGIDYTYPPQGHGQMPGSDIYASYHIPSQPQHMPYRLPDPVMNPSAHSPPHIQVAPIPFELDFKSSTWQNRPSRIYIRLKDESLDLSGLEELESGSRFLVLTEQNTPPKVVLTSKQMNKIPSFHYQANRPFFELQIWHRTGRFSEMGQPEPALLLDAHSYLISHQPIEINLLRINSSRSGPYFTIQCNKGFKVQDLFLRCIFRTGNNLFISEATPFPSAETRKQRTKLTHSSGSMRDSPLSSPQSSEQDADY